MKTQDEILTRVNASTSLFGFDKEVLVPFLDFEHAKSFLKPEVTKEGWQPSPLTEEVVKKELADYLQFAWDKALNHRGLSAGRSIEKLTEWLWLLDDEELVTQHQYKNYGVPILLAISKKYELPYPTTTDAMNMAEGKPCRENCEEGCAI